MFSTFLWTSLDDFEALGANLSALGAILEPLGEHSGGPGGFGHPGGGPQNGPKSKTKRKMPKEVFQARLREVLEPSWTDLWAILAELEAI